MLRDNALIWQGSPRPWNYYHHHLDFCASPHVTLSWSPIEVTAGFSPGKQQCFALYLAAPSTSYHSASCFSNCSSRKWCMTEDMTMTLIYILPFSGRVDQRLQSIVAPPWSGAQQKAYIIRDGLSKQISHATDSITLGRAGGINNHHTHFVSYASLEMDAGNGILKAAYLSVLLLSMVSIPDWLF